MASCGKYADISVSPGALSFEAVEGWKFVTPSQYVRITKANAGRDPYWTASVEGDWIGFCPDQGRGPGRIRINCGTRDLAAGLYVGAIIIESNVAVDIPRIAVVLTVHPKDTVPLPPMEDVPEDDPEAPETPENPPDDSNVGETIPGGETGPSLPGDHEDPEPDTKVSLWQRLINFLVWLFTGGRYD